MFHSKDTNKWEKPDVPDDCLPPARSGATLTSIGKKRLLLFGGFDGNSFFNDVWIFDTRSYLLIIEHSLGLMVRNLRSEFKVVAPHRDWRYTERPRSAFSKQDQWPALHLWRSCVENGAQQRALQVGFG